MKNPESGECTSIRQKKGRRTISEEYIKKRMAALVPVGASRKKIRRLIRDAIKQLSSSELQNSTTTNSPPHISDTLHP